MSPVNANLSPVERAAMAAWKPQDIRLPWEWCEDHVEVDNTSPMPGKWRSSNSPWVKEVMEQAAEKRVRHIAVKCSAQSSKTQTVLGLLGWCICEDPGPTMYVMANKDDAEDFVRDRASPMLDACEPVKALKVRETKLNFTFRTMPLYFLGAGSKGKLQGKPMKRLFLDEVRNYPPGSLETVKKRVTAFGQLAQIFIISTPGNKGDAVDQAFLRGDQRTFHFPCPKCGTLQQLKLEHLKCEHPDTHQACKFEELPGARELDADGKETGRWNFEILGRAIRLQCVSAKCGHLISDTPTERKAICRMGHFIRMNPNAEPCDVSFTWNAMLPWWVSWRGIVKEYLLALDAARMGNIEPLRTFVTETLGEAWEDRLGVIEDFGFLEGRKAEYDYGEVWPAAERRFMAADKQEKGGEHYWYIIRDFGKFGASRLVTHGRCNTFAELEAIRREYKIGDTSALIDSGYKAQQVYRFCLSSKWKAFKGEARDYYLVPKPHPQNPKMTITGRQLWNKSTAVAYNVETKLRIGNLPLYLFCNEATNDLLAEYMTGLVGEWTIPKNTAREFLRQMTGDVRKEHTDSRGVLSYQWHTVSDNHYRDCERMILTAAIIVGIVNAPAPAAKSAKAKTL